MSDCPLPLFPDTLNCSGRGIGCSQNQCACEDGWTGNGDFVSGSPACHLNVAGVRACWAFVTIASPFSLLICLWCLHKRTLKVVWFKDPPFLSCLAGMLGSICLTALGLVRLIDPTRTIGTDPAATILFAIASVSFWTFVPISASIFLNLLRLGLSGGRNEHEMARVKVFFNVLRRVLPFLWFFCMCASIAPLFILINPGNPTLMYGLAATNYVVLATAVATASAMSEMVSTPLLKELQASLSMSADSRVKNVESKLHRYRDEVRRQGIFQALSAGIFGLWPYAQRYSSYQVPLAWLGGAFLVGAGTYTIMPAEKKVGSNFTDTSSKPRGVEHAMMADIVVKPHSDA